MEDVNGLKATEQIRKKDEKVGLIFWKSLKQYALEEYKYQASIILSSLSNIFGGKIVFTFRNGTEIERKI